MKDGSTEHEFLPVVQVCKGVSPIKGGWVICCLFPNCCCGGRESVEVVRDFFWSGGLFSSFLFDLCFMRVCSADGLGFSECLRTIIK